MALGLAKAARSIARFSLFALAGILSLAGLFALGNLAVTAVYFADHNQIGRLASDVPRLALSGATAHGADAVRHFRRLYSKDIGPDPAPGQIRRYFERQLAEDGPLVLDQVLADYIVARWGAIDDRTLPAGVYVGARAIGPDKAPLSQVTTYLGQYAIYPRHGYVLVVAASPDPGPPMEFSASRAADFADDPTNPQSLAIQPEPFEPGAYDFPGRGQAIHELYRLTDDPRIIGKTVPELKALATALKSTNAPYELFRQNSNTVLGCMLRASDLHRDNFQRLRRDGLVSLRLMAIGRPLWTHPVDRKVPVRCE